MHPNHNSNAPIRGRLSEAQRAKPARTVGVLLITLAIACTMLPTPLRADTVEMKSGRVIENCQTRQRGKSVVIDTGSAVFTVPMAQIERIEEEAVKREGPRPTPTPTQHPVTPTPTAEPQTRTTKQARPKPSGVSSGSEPDWSWMNDCGPRTPPIPAPKSGQYDWRLCDQVKTVYLPHEKYPRRPASGVAECAAQVPDDAAHKAYLRDTRFQASSLAALGVELAQPQDVRRDKSLYGYLYSDKPPAYVPEIGYNPADVPIYGFVGQKVPGTQHWLVDTTEINGQQATVPALTTMPFYWFRSINWPRERYLEAVRKAHVAPDHRISGTETRNPRVLNGVVSATGDYVVGGFGGGRGNHRAVAYFMPGTVVVAKAQPQVTNPRDREQLRRLAGYSFNSGHDTRHAGTAQRPIVWTVGAEEPRPGTWREVGSYGGEKCNCTYNLFEYGVGGLKMQSKFGTVRNCIFRHGFCARGTEVAGLLCIEVNSQTRNNEYHNCWDCINLGPHAPKARMSVRQNICYLSLKGIFSGGDNRLRVSQNICILNSWAGISSEDDSTPENKYWENVSVLNTNGFMMYHVEPKDSNPYLARNNSWQNHCTWVANPQENPANFTKGNQFSGHYIVDKYNSKNHSQDPLFRNVKIYDLRRLVRVGNPPE